MSTVAVVAWEPICPSLLPLLLLLRGIVQVERQFLTMPQRTLVLRAPNATLLRMYVRLLRRYATTVTRWLSLRFSASIYFVTVANNSLL